MVNHDEASRLARAGFDLWKVGRLEEALPLYRQALEQVDPDHWSADAYHAQYAALLAALGRDDDARRHYELSLAAAQRSDGDEEGPAVLVARYFLSHHLVRMNAPSDALNVLEPVPFNGSQQDSALRTVEAMALWHLGRREESRQAAEAAVAAASSESTRKHVLENVGSILQSGD